VTLPLATRRISLSLLLLFLATTLSARIISYAPYTDRSSFPAIQHRMNRHFALVEVAPTTFGTQPPSLTWGQLVLYDFENENEPRVIYPESGAHTFTVAAVRESAQGVPVILIQSSDSLESFTFKLSTDGGASWKTLALPTEAVPQLGLTGVDVGGPYAGSRHSPVRIGTEEYPFVVAQAGKIQAVRNDGTTKLLYTAPGSSTRFTFAGSNKEGTQFLVRTSSEIVIVGLDGQSSALMNAFTPLNPEFEGWITPDRRVYLLERSQGRARIFHFAGAARETLLDAAVNDVLGAFAVPTWDYSGAWVVDRGTGKPTSLYRHENRSELMKQWEDITAPEVEAIHAGSSGAKLLVQVHRPRPAVDARIIIDPALAVWRVGQSAPRVYDELFMNEQPNKGFVHLDVEKIEDGTPFVFDSGSQAQRGGGGIIISPPPPSSGGSDVTQEWGVVRASLKQRLVLPSVGRIKGAFGSDWVTDVIIQNPLDTAQKVEVIFTAAGTTTQASGATRTTLTLKAFEIRLVDDVLANLFSIESSVGALFLDPEAGVTVTSRTYSRSSQGTFGFGMNAVDIFAAAASSRFPVSFAGAFQGPGFRTNITLTDTSGRGTVASLLAASNNGPTGNTDVSFSTPANGHEQINGVAEKLGLFPHEAGALQVRPSRGFAVASVFSVDNRTNDSTYFPPDLPSATFARTIPAIGHLDGANGSKFRSDLYLFNPSDQPRMVTLQMKLWTTQESPTFLTLTLLPKEARVIRDILSVFGRTGIAWLRYQSSMADGSGVRVTSRTYNVDANGGTFGFLMPPLNNFQIGGSGDTLEILGAVADGRYRTNIGLVELTQWPNGRNVGARVEILDSNSRVVDSFSVNVPTAGGMQLNDVLNARGISASGPILIRVSPTSGTIGAYATSTDNETNDSIYLAANLAATQ